MADQANQHEVRYLGDVQRLVLAPGDVLVVKAPRVLSTEQQLRIREYISHQLGDDTRVIVLEQGCDIGVLSPQAA